MKSIICWKNGIRFQIWQTNSSYPIVLIFYFAKNPFFLGSAICDIFRYHGQLKPGYDTTNIAHQSNPSSKLSMIGIYQTTKALFCIEVFVQACHKMLIKRFRYKIWPIKVKSCSVNQLILFFVLNFSYKLHRPPY